MWKAFKEFAMRGNVLDMAVGVIIGGAFGKIVTSLVNDVIMPPIGLLVSKVDFTQLCFDLQQHRFTTLATVKASGSPSINIGVFLNNVIDFLIVAVVIFMFVRFFQKMKTKALFMLPTTPPPAPSAPPVPTTRACPFCCSQVPLAAVRCPFCTSDLTRAPGGVG